MDNLAALPEVPPDQTTPPLGLTKEAFSANLEVAICDLKFRMLICFERIIKMVRNAILVLGVIVLLGE